VPNYGNNEFQDPQEKTEWDDRMSHHNSAKYAWEFAIDGFRSSVKALPLILFSGIAFGSQAFGQIFLSLAVRSLILAWLIMLLIGALYNNGVVSIPISYIPCIPIAFLLVLASALLLPRSG